MSNMKLFESNQIRTVWNDKEKKWFFSVVDVVGVLTDSQNPQVYWRVLKKRLLAEGNETVTNCNALKMTAQDGKMRLTDVADTEQLLRLIQSIPSPKAEPFKRWLARVGYERLEEIENPELAATRMHRGMLRIRMLLLKADQLLEMPVVIWSRNRVAASAAGEISSRFPKLSKRSRSNQQSTKRSNQIITNFFTLNP